MASITKHIAPKPQAETRSAVDRIGAFAVAVRPEHLTPDIRQLLKRNILDSIGCAIAAVAGPSLRTLRDQIEEYRAPGRCTLIGGGKTSPDQGSYGPTRRGPVHRCLSENSPRHSVAVQGR